MYIPDLCCCSSRRARTMLVLTVIVQTGKLARQPRTQKTNHNPVDFKRKKCRKRAKVSFVGKLAEILESREHSYINWSPSGDYMIIQRDVFEVRN